MERIDTATIQHDTKQLERLIALVRKTEKLRGGALGLRSGGAVTVKFTRAIRQQIFSLDIILVLTSNIVGCNNLTPEQSLCITLIEAHIGHIRAIHYKYRAPIFSARELAIYSRNIIALKACIESIMNKSLSHDFYNACLYIADEARENARSSHHPDLVPAWTEIIGQLDKLYEFAESEDTAEQMNDGASMGRRLLELMA